MSNEVAVHQPGNDLAHQIEFARMVTDNRGQSILPDNYKGNPSNVLIAVGLGQAMGLTPAESLYRINVIKGKPSAAAELIAANVRKAGHKLRMQITDEPASATCTIIRADDPDYPTSVTRDMAWAQRMGLANEPNYRKQPATMLSWRAISACARLACPEALYGVQYTPDEVGDAPEVEAAPRATVETFTSTPVRQESAPHVEEAQEVDEPEPMQAKTRRKLFALFGKKGIAEDQQLAGINYRLGRSGESAYTSRGDLTEDDAQSVIAYLDSLDDVPPDQPVDDGAMFPQEQS